MKEERMLNYFSNSSICDSFSDMGCPIIDFSVRANNSEPTGPTQANRGAQEKNSFIGKLSLSHPTHGKPCRS
jgi:hypothetical protein